MNKMSNRSLRFRTAACAAALGLTVGSSLAFAADPMTTATGGDLSSADRKFVTKATTGGMEEVALGELAEKQASSQAVKDFGARMVKDHTAANEDLVKVAAAKGVTVPGEMTSSQKSDVGKMSKKSGADFDKAYVKAMVSDHKTDIADFQKEAKSGKDGDLQAFAGKTLLTLREHLQMIESIHDGMK